MINCSQLFSSTCLVHENQVKVKVSIKRSVLYLDEDIVMIMTAAIFVATTVASDTIFVTLASFCLAFGLAGAFEEALPSSVAVKTSCFSHTN